MIEFDHVAITSDNLEQSLDFYKKIGYTLQAQFEDEDYRWATLSIGNVKLEVFEPSNKGKTKIEHIAYSFTDDEEVFQLALNLGYQPNELNIFYGDLKQKSFVIKDNNGLSIQFIKK